MRRPYALPESNRITRSGGSVDRRNFKNRIMLIMFLLPQSLKRSVYLCKPDRGRVDAYKRRIIIGCSSLLERKLLFFVLLNLILGAVEAEGRAVPVVAAFVIFDDALIPCRD